MSKHDWLDEKEATPTRLKEKTSEAESADGSGSSGFDEGGSQPDGDCANSVVVKATPDLPFISEDYDVLQLIGQGGMGRVYKVRDRATSRLFALKVLPREITLDAAAAQRFDNEVAALSLLDHPNIVALHDHGRTAEGIPYLVMDYIEGESLAQYLKKQTRLDEKAALPVFIAIAEALAYAHKRGLMHRDLKPSNVILSKSIDGAFAVHLVDFGLAKVMPPSMARDTQNLTRTGEIFGSPAYMSPEQCLGFRLDERSDIYSFGCLMYEVISGRTPFEAANPIQMVVKQLNESPSSWSNTREGRNLVGLEALTFRCLQKDKDERIQTADELLKQLNLLNQGKKIVPFHRTKIPKAVLSSGQAFILILEVGLLLTYWLLASSNIMLISLSALATPVVWLLLFFHIMKQRLRGNCWDRWQFLGLMASNFACISSVLVTAGLFWGGLEKMSENFQFAFAAVLAFHFVSVIVVMASCLGIFCFYKNKSESWRRILAQFSLISVAAVGLAFCDFGAFSNITPHVPQSMTSSIRFFRSLEEARPKLMWAISRVSIALDPKNTESYEPLTTSAETLKRAKEALPLVDYAVKNTDDFWHDRLLAERAKLEYLTGSYEAALTDLEMALKNSTSRYYRREFLELRGDIYLARAEYEKALADYGDAWSDYANDSLKQKSILAMWRLGRRESAILEMNKLIHNQETDYGRAAENYYFERGLLLDAVGKTDLAKSDFVSLTQIKPTEEIEAKTTPLMYLSKMMINTFSSREHEDRLSGQMHLRRAYAYSKLGESAQAAAELDKARALGVDKKTNDDKFVQAAGIELKW